MSPSCSCFHNQRLFLRWSIAAVTLFLATQAFAGAATIATMTGVGPGAYHGSSVATAGDVNRDGYDDWIVSAPTLGPGFAFLYLGGPTPDDVPDLVLAGEVSGDAFGLSVATAGDVNGDGYADVVVGSHLNQAAGTAAGRAYVYFGAPVPDAVPDLVLTGVAPADQFGVAVASAGDMNHDGYADVLVGAYAAGQIGVLHGPGRAYVYFGGATPDNVADLTFAGENPDDFFGDGVAGIGDLNRDGFDDIVIGAPLHDTVGSDAGRAYVFFGGNPPDLVADLTLDAESAGDFYGFSVASAGDVNKDGDPDLIIGALFNDAGGADAGRAYVYLGGVIPDIVPDLILTGQQPADYFARSAVGTGDLNGDGYGDLLVGAHRHWNGASEGAAYVFFGGSVLDATADVVIPSAALVDVYVPGAGDGFGQALGAAGQVDGAGSREFLVGAHINDSGGIDAGQAYLFTLGPPPLDAPATPSTPVRLMRPLPNPAREVVTLGFQTDRPCHVSLRVFDLAGRRIAAPFEDQTVSAGRTLIEWRPRGLTSGVYRLEAVVDGHRERRSMVWLGGN